MELLEFSALANSRPVVGTASFNQTLTAVYIFLAKLLAITGTERARLEPRSIVFQYLGVSALPV